MQNGINWLDACLREIRQVRVAVFGDFCLDAYWLIDDSCPELSVETSLPVRRVRRQRYSLGGAANVAANLTALGVGSVAAVGLAGDDLFGELMRRMLDEAGVGISGLLSSQEDWDTFVFGKPIVDGVEQSRIDFGGFNRISPESIQRLAGQLRRASRECDVVILNQQVPAGVSTAAMIDQINAVIAASSRCRFIVDSRHRAELYRGAMLKVNEHEAARIAGEARPLAEQIPTAAVRRVAEKLYKATARPVFVTRGENGMVICTEDGLQEVPGIQIIERTDTVGAGDTTVAAIAAVIAAGGGCLTAAKFANIAASVTVRKLFTTGLATPAEIRRVGPEPDYTLLPDLAADPRQASYLPDTGIELVRELAPLQVRHAVFDHDGTLSTLRQGWEGIMEPMMVKAVLGKRYAAAERALHDRVVEAVRLFIDRTTGVQTLVQMQHLVELVRQFGYVDEPDILDMHGYKALYNEALLEMVHQRTTKLRRGELAADDFQIKGARRMLEALHAAGVTLYLASGTDQADVVAEAEALGYADVFQGRIFGAVGDVARDAKRMVLEQILREHDLRGPQFATFGDGPVEMRETRRQGGVCVGVASDEVRRAGLNEAKRARLVKAGADLIIPDWTQPPPLLALLGVPGC